MVAGCVGGDEPEPEPEVPEVMAPPSEECFVRTGEEEECTEETRPDGIVVTKCSLEPVCSSCGPVQDGTCTWQGDVLSCFDSVDVCEN